MRNLFITGTDTGVGKTVLAAALLCAMRARGVDAVPMKPVQTGCQRRSDGNLDAPDLDFCLRAAGLHPSPEEKEQMGPYRFVGACSPHLAAAQNGAAIHIDRIAESFRRLAGVHDAVIVEGAGGVMVPISDDETMLAVMKALALPVVLAARPGLGTINHTFLSLTVLRNAGLDICAVVLVDSSTAAWGTIEEDNAATIRKMGGATLVLRLPFVPDLDVRDPAEALRPVAEVLAPLLV